MNKHFDFMGKRTIAAIFSVALLVLSIGSLVTQGLNFGLDFTGGTQVEVGYDTPADLAKIRALLKENGFADATVQLFGKPTEVLVRIPPREGKDKAEVGEQVKDVLISVDDTLTLKRVEFVGPQVGEELRDQSGSAMIFALGLMLVYVTLRFQLKFALGAVTALFHDVLIVIGFFSVLQITFDLTVLAAVLAVIGYSLNDTIVVADRIRENFRKLREGDGVDIINVSLNQTLGRTIITSVTTLLVLTSLAVFGGELIHGFAVALLVGVVIGTYSSIYVASNVLLAMNISREDFLEKEEDIPEVP
ncbi:protein-export membrane protein SecF [Gammaproteobacteria bacterium 42_54_T18]|nr:protein-export membrane protein SecF [Gammaproteobacteria bacterium 42_54_T18]